MSWTEVGDWRIWLEPSTWLVLLVCLAPALAAIAIGLALGGPEMVSRLFIPRFDDEGDYLPPHAPWVDEPDWIEDAESALYDRVLERDSRGYAPRTGLGPRVAPGDAGR
jgi:hypothetical protein